MTRTDVKIPLKDVLKEMGVSRAAFYRMRARGQAPKLIKLPNGHLRVSRAELDHWWDGLEETA
ncbi:helix-turn-helix domain-containing protein [Streptomycetaceae bacterium NBC_01309]